MTRPRALTSTFKSVIALITALLISVVGATALPAAALAGNSGHAKGQADRAEKPGKAHQQDKAQQSKAPRASKSQSNGKAPERGSSAKAQEPAKAEKTQPARGHSAQAQLSKTGSGSSATKSGDTSGDKGDPAGNNGTVKLAGFGGTNGPGHSSGTGSTPKHPSNDPHLPCGFSVEWFGFDSGVTSEVTFEQHAPTRGGSAKHDSVQLDADSASGGGSTAGYDGVATYMYDWE